MKLYVGKAKPKGWGEDFLTLTPKSVSELREATAEFEAYHFVNTVVGLDLRWINTFQLSVVLKPLEDFGEKVLVRVNEPVPGTLLSRALEVFKEEDIEIKRMIDLIVDDDSIIAEKIRRL